MLKHGLGNPLKHCAGFGYSYRTQAVRVEQKTIDQEDEIFSFLAKNLSVIEVFGLDFTNVESYPSTYRY